MLNDSATQEKAGLYSAEEVSLRARARLSLELPGSAIDPAHKPRRGDHVLNPGIVDETFAARATPAAVLIPIVPRANGAHVLLTQRATGLRRHPGQIAFPGGRIDPEDDGPLDAALREAGEEIGLERHTVTPLGFLDPYLTHSGYRILPLVAMLNPPFSLICNPDEVAEAFEVPMGFLMDDANHRQESRMREGIERHFYSMSYCERNIWGVTAGILRNLHERLYS